MGTPVMSMMAISAIGLDDRLQQVLHHDLGAAAVQRADQGQRDDPVPEFHHRGREFLDLLAMARDQLFPGPSGRFRP